MAASGLAVFHPERKIGSRPASLPDALQKELMTNAQAWTNFRIFPPYYQRMTVAWVASAKKEETQRKRLQQLIEFSAENKRIKLCKL